MPRHKRQRPRWLPACVPFKDGRYLGLARQTLLAWSSTVLAIFFFCMTATFAFGSSRLTQARPIYSSQSNLILVLRMFSEAAGLFLAGTVHSTFEICQWILVSRPEGIRFPQFLALQSSTGPLGLIALALGRGLPPNEWPVPPRLTSLIRLMAEVAVPLLGVLIMSNVATEMIYVSQRDTVQPMAFGMTAFNGSVAAQFGVMSDMFFNLGYVTFLSNPQHAIDITPGGPTCAKGLSMNATQSCKRVALMAQELQNVNANLPLPRESVSQVVLSSNQLTYSFEFIDNIVMEDSYDCKDFNSGPAWYIFCVGNTSDGNINAKMVPCPPDLVNTSSCKNNTSWRSSRGFTSSLAPSLVRADIAYQRLDYRILWHAVQSDAIPTKINSSDLLDALGEILATENSTSHSLGASNSILGSPTHFFGRLVAGHMYRIGTLNLRVSAEAHWRGINALQNLLAIAIYYCQNGILSQTVLPFASGSSNNTSSSSSKGAFEQSENSSFVSLAESHYRLKVGRATVYAYIILYGVTLVVCIVVLIFGSLIELARLDAEPTLWPALDFYTQCRVEDENGKIQAVNKRVEMAWIYDGRQMFREMEGLRVRRRKRQPTPFEPEAIRAEES